MRDLHELDRYRDTTSFLGAGNHQCGLFFMKKKNVILKILVTNGAGWDHVSVSTNTRCPTWDEMEFVKRAFFKDDETAMQLHVPPTDHKNVHPNCLHLWRPTHVSIPRPPQSMV